MPTQSTIETPEAAADLAFWRELAGGDDESVRELIELYLADTAQHIGLMRTGLAAGSAEEVGRAAHTCAGSSGICGMDDLAASFRALEHQARESQLGESGATSALIGRQFDQVRARLMAALSIA